MAESSESVYGVKVVNWRLAIEGFAHLVKEQWTNFQHSSPMCQVSAQARLIIGQLSSLVPRIYGGGHITVCNSSSRESQILLRLLGHLYFCAHTYTQTHVHIIGQKGGGYYRALPEMIRLP